ncbi:MAG: hypothetical protein NVV82_28265 [Sporocytophaga sp.]|jgi:hypothetical protein|nr:hypothetical protein [Sporocytophaga sp.]
METPTKKVHRNKEEMYLLISSWKESGISQNAFCEQHNLPYSIFQYWLKKFKIEAEEQESVFTEIKISSSSVSCPIEIIFPSGARVVFKSLPESSFLRSLVF